MDSKDLSGLSLPRATRPLHGLLNLCSLSGARCSNDAPYQPTNTKEEKTMREFSFNVALDGEHLLRTDWYDEDDMGRIKAVIIQSFPRSKGYVISLYERDTKTLFGI